MRGREAGKQGGGEARKQGASKHVSREAGRQGGGEARRQGASIAARKQGASKLDRLKPRGIAQRFNVGAEASTP